MMLGDLGARVVKVEAPGAATTPASWGPPFLEREGERTSTYFLAANRNKESLTLDLKDTSDGGDLAVLEELVRRADVLVENFRVGVMGRLGLGVERLHELNPGLVILSITGFGHDGPEATRAGYDQIAQGEGGLMSLTGDTDPTKTGVPIADLLAGMNGAYGVAAALFERERARAAGEPAPGRVVRTSLLSSVVGVHAYQGTRLDRGATRCRVSRAPTTRRSRRTGCSTRDLAGAGGLRRARGCGGRSRRSSGSTPPTRGSRPTSTG